MARRRSTLCVPAGDPHRIGKALASGADEVVVDLEDAVAAGDKDAARAVLADFDWSAHERPGRLAVRVNGLGTPWCHRDLDALVAHDLPIDTVVVPKVESRTDLAVVERLLEGLEAEAGTARRLGLQALVETAAGLLALPDVVRDVDRLDSLIIGYADLAASLARRPTATADTWLPARHQLLTAARAAGVEAVDGPFLGVADDEPFRVAVAGAADLGFDAKWAIHPRQVAFLNEAFQPTAAAVAHAERVLAALDEAAGEGRGAVQLDGELLDEAMAVAARAVVAKAGR